MGARPYIEMSVGTDVTMFEAACDTECADRDRDRNRDRVKYECHVRGRGSCECAHECGAYAFEMVYVFEVRDRRHPHCDRDRE